MNGIKIKSDEVRPRKGKGGEKKERKGRELQLSKTSIMATPTTNSSTAHRAVSFIRNRQVIVLVGFVLVLNMLGNFNLLIDFNRNLQIEFNRMSLVKKQNQSQHQQHTQHQHQQQCHIAENHTVMDANWLKVATKNGWLPRNTTGIPPEGVYSEEWYPLKYPSLDCPSAFETLQWGGNGEKHGELICPPGAPMWTFHEESMVPAISGKNSTRVLCPDSGTYLLSRGWGLLCQNSMRLRPSRSNVAIARAQGLAEKRKQQEQTKRQTSSNNITSSHNTTTAGRPPHILLYMQDAVSRPALYRNMKTLRRTIQDITDRGTDLGTHVYEFQRHHTVGGGSIRNLAPMLTGLLLTNIEDHNNTYEAWAFEEFRRMGYITIHTNNNCRYNNAHHGSTFARHSPEHYLPYSMEDISWFSSVFCPLPKRDKTKIPINEVQANCARTPQDTAEDCKPSLENNMGHLLSCLGGRSRSSMMVEHYLKIREDHKEDNVPTFAFMHDFDLHVEDITILNRYDNDKAAIFQMLEKSGVLRDTVIIFISDHGNHQKITMTNEGAIEYKLPFWYLAVPEEVLSQRGQDTREALKANQHVLTSHSDVHETMLDLAGGWGMGDAQWWQQHGHDPYLNGNSVLEALPYNRTCADAGIPALECVCGGTIPQEHAPNSAPWNMVMRKVLPKIVAHMNQELEKHELISSGVCRKLIAKAILTLSSRPITEKLTGYTLRYLIKSPRSEPMEFFATAGRGVMERRGVYVTTVLQSSRFAHWIEQCRHNVTVAGGNLHFCDCVEPPPVGGWEFNRTQQQ